jgi:glycine oxidase
MGRAPDVLVVGGGVIGCAIARQLAAAGRSVLVVDRGAIGAEATSAAAGVLAVASGEEVEGPGLALRRASLARFGALAGSLADESGIDVEYAVRGVLELCLSDEDEAAASARIAARRAQGFRAEWMDAAAIRREEPAANPAARGGIVFAEDAQVNNVRLVEALACAASRKGAELRPGAEVVGAERDGDRIARVRIGSETVTPGTVVLAAGAWAARVAGLAPGIGVEPARGQMLALRPRTPLVRRILSYRDGYLVPRRNGEALVGATVEHVGFDKAVTPAGLAELQAKLARLAPAALDVPVARVWAGLRPFAPTGGPIIARARDTANLIVACGHHRNGILLAPITAEMVAELVGAA